MPQAPARLVPAESRTRFGMLTPSSNTALEPLTQALVAPLVDRVSVHFSRFRVTQIALDAGSNEQFREAPILQAAALLADAKADVIAWNGTSASWLGFERDRALCEKIEAETGARATSAIESLNEALTLHGVRRLGLVTPYTTDVQVRIAANYNTIGIEIPGEVHSGLADNFSFAGVAESDIAEMCRAAAALGVDAIAIVCTNMRGTLVAPTLEHELDVPVLDSIAVTLWGSLRKAGIPTAPLARFGRIFATPAA